MERITRRTGVRKAVMAVAPALLRAEQPPNPNTPEETRLPNGKIQRDEILKAEYASNLKDARELVDLSRNFELDLEKSDRFVLSVGLLKKLDDMEKLTRRIRARMKK